MKEQRLYLQPFVDTFSMELVRAGQDPHHLPGLEVRHADDADSLVTLTGVSFLGRIPAAVKELISLLCWIRAIYRGNLQFLLQNLGSCRTFH